MAYQNNVPLSTDLISTSQSDILNNFQAIGTVYPTDHVGFNASGAGFHQRVTFNGPIADPGQIAPLTSLYTKAAPSTTISDLYYQVGTLASDVSQLTGGGITTAAWCQFNGTSVGTNVPNAGYNVTNVTRVAAGNYTINFTRNFANTNYAFLPFVSTSFFLGITITNRAVGSCTILLGPAIDSTDVNLAIFGKLA